MRVGLPVSSWLSARTLRAATGAIYVVVDGKPIRASAGDTCYLMKYIDHLSGLVGRGQIDLGSDTSSALAAYQGARTDFEKRFAEAGGQGCI